MMWQPVKKPRTTRPSERAAAFYGDDFGYYLKKSRMSEKRLNNEIRHGPKRRDEHGLKLTYYRLACST